MAERLDYIDRAKGILIILVVIGHIWQSGVVFDFIYTFHMPAFFVISGLLLAHTHGYEKRADIFLRKHVFSYGIPFLFFECLGVLVQILRHGVTQNWKGYLFDTVTLNLNAPQCWFLVALFLIEIIFVAAVKTIKNPVVICLSCCILFFARYALPTEVLYVSTVAQLCKYLPFFLAGFYCSKWWNKNSPVMVLLCTIVVLVSTFWGGKLTGRISKDMDLLIGGFCGTYLSIQLARCKLPQKVNVVLQKAGKNSLVIYGTHYLYYAALGLILGVADFASTPYGLGAVILAGVAVLEIPTIYIINRWLPFLAGKRLKRSKTA